MTFFEKIFGIPKEIECYASIDQLDTECMVLEIESTSIEESADIPLLDRSTYMFELVFKKDVKFESLGTLSEGDVIVVKVSEDNVIPIRKADDEKAKRVALLSELMKQIQTE